MRGRKGSPLQNPYKITENCSRTEVIEKFEAYARGNPVIMGYIKALPKDAVLGCWCAPLPCHGMVIRKIWIELHDLG